MPVAPAGEQFSCRIELSRADGVTVVIQDAKKKDRRARTLVVGPAGITLTCVDGAVTSVIRQRDGALRTEVTTDKGTTSLEQDGETIACTCKTFRVKAETLELHATQDGAVVTGGKLTVKSTADAVVESSAKLTAKSVGQLELSSAAGLDVAATARLALSGAQAELEGKTTVAVKSGGTAELSGMTVAVSGQTQLSAEAPITSIGRNMTTVKGQIVEVSGALVKVG